MLICLHVALVQMHELGYRIHLQSFEGPLIQSQHFAKWQEPNIRNYWFDSADV